MTIDRRKKYYLVLDVETANILDYPLAYDIGFIVGDRYGNIYERFSFSVREMFMYYGDLLETAYYAEKLPSYQVDIDNGTRKMESLYNIRKTLLDVMAKYKIHSIYAYNCGFDRRALNNTQRYLTKSKYRWFFPYGIKFYCIWNMACSTVLQHKTFKQLAIKRKWLSPSGKFYSTSAETVYKYVAGSFEFEEEHKGLEDVLIEYEIMLRCMNQKKKMTKHIDSQCWRKVK